MVGAIVSMGKKIMILAGTHFQVPVIECTRNQGHFVITCDNIPDNPGHKLADKYYNVSTTDLDGVLNIARKEKIDGILAYGSDPAAPTAAYVSERLKLPGNEYSTVLTLTDKGLFRKFLLRNKFNTPEFGVCKSLREFKELAKGFQNPFYIKPVDSSGGKGVTRIEQHKYLEEAFRYALSYSRKGEIIVEEEIIKKGPNIHGEAFVYNGKIKFMLLGDQYFNQNEPYAPLTTLLPSTVHKDLMGKIHELLSNLLNRIGFKTGGLNIEIIRDNKDRIYFVEIGARSGGNFMPQLIRAATGFDLVAADIKGVLDEEINYDHSFPDGNFFAYVILQSPVEGKFLNYYIPEVFNEYIIKELVYVESGSNISHYHSSRDAIGIVLFSSVKERLRDDFIKYVVSNNIVTIIN